ncbi:alginate lyase family protein [Thioclava litoralis]|uniref:Alginate lyase family protein n=1 Tax=Thioclava litoralis TaxID=3076557 RepID=A0ABZ1E0T7_9RHOB|nr:alginate lyase family protein [Thioclava sp. FTW29]
MKTALTLPAGCLLLTLFPATAILAETAPAMPVAPDSQTGAQTGTDTADSPDTAPDTAPDTETSDPKAQQAETCFDEIAPVVSLSYGSRYTEDSETRSEFDEASNREVNEALKPVDMFISKLARESNRALSRKGERGEASAHCVFDRLETWAQADALSDLGSMNAQISVPSRLGGIVFAYRNALEVATPDPVQKDHIDNWLKARAQAHMTYFDTDAPERASRNNLRQWAGLAVALVGLTTEDEAMIAWANETVDYTACHADPDGALPLEMERGELSLHYQMHAVTPLVVTAALLTENTPLKPFDACEGAISKIVNYTLAGLEDPSAIETRTGVAQKMDDDLKSYDFAWGAAYLKYEDSSELSEIVSEFPGLSNSKLGGDQSLVW